MRPLIDIIAVYKLDNTIFDNFNMPVGIEKDNVINNIIAECAELPLVWTNPIFLKDLIASWSSNEMHSWNKIYEALKAEYSPIENYDRHEESTDTRTPDLVNTYTDRDNTYTSDIYANGYNSGNQVKTNKTVSTNDVVTTNGTSGSDKNEHEAHIHGNIGVTTNQQMIEAEIDLRTRYCMENIILNAFKNKFCIIVY